MNHPCPRYEPELSAYLDGETTEVPRAEIETHLRACEPCRAAVAQLRGVSRTLRRWDAQETRYATTSGFRNRVFSKVGAENVDRRPNWRVAAAIGLVAVGAGGFALVSPRSRAPESPEMRALSAKVAGLEAALRTRSAPVEVAGARVPETELERAEPLGPVVTPPEPAGEGPTSPAFAAEVWEQRGGRRFLREALPDHRDFTRERDMLSLLEQIEMRLKPPSVTVNRPTEAAIALSPLATFLAELRVAASNYPSFEQIQVWPIELIGTRAGDASHLVPCSDAIQQEILVVTEGPVKESVVAANTDPRRSVLVLAGDVLAGGRQDRVAREDVLVAPGERLSIATYTCGRERQTSYRRFRRSDGLATPELRALVTADRALLADGFVQRDFDVAVARTVNALASPGHQGSLDNLFSNPGLAAEAERLLKKFEKRLDGPAVVGFAFSAGSQVLGVEAFGDHATFTEHRTRVLSSYVLSAIAMDRREGESPSRDAVAAIVAAAPKGAFHSETQTLAGTLAVFRGVEGGAFGCGVLDGAHVVHAVLFPSAPAGVDVSTSRGGNHRDPGNSSSPLGKDGDAGGAGRGESGHGEGVDSR